MQPMPTEAEERRGRSFGRWSLLGALAAPAILLVADPFRPGVYAFASALLACAALWTVRARLGPWRWLAFPVVGYLGGVAGALFRPTYMRLSSPDPSDRLLWIVETTHPDALLLGLLYVGLGFAIATPFFPGGSGRPPPVRGWGVALAVVVALGGCLSAHLANLAIPVRAEYTYRSEMDRAISQLPTAQLNRRADTGSYTSDLEALDVDLDTSRLDVRMTVLPNGGWEAEVRHLLWRTRECHLTLPPTADTTRASTPGDVECVPLEGRRPISWLR